MVIKIETSKLKTGMIIRSVEFIVGGGTEILMTVKGPKENPNTMRHVLYTVYDVKPDSNSKSELTVRNCSPIYQTNRKYPKYSSWLHLSRMRRIL